MFSGDAEDFVEISFETERYIASLYENSEIGITRLSTTELSDQLNLHPATISNKLKSLNDLRIQDHKIFNYEKRYGTQLTHVGQTIGAKIIRKKRLKELFLKSLGLTLKEIDCQIDQTRITEKISELLYRKIIDELPYGKKKQIEDLRCPHGALIPNIDGSVKPEIFYPLSYFPTSTVLTLHRLPKFFCQRDKKTYYNIVNSENLYPGMKISNWKYLKEGNIQVTKLEEESTFILNAKLADSIYFTDKRYNYYTL